MRVSVIIPVYNGAATLADCLVALSESRCKPFERIVVDDGSTDGSCAIAAQFGVTVLSTGGRHGPAYARNLGAKQATGDLLLFTDSDVALHADALNAITSRFSEDAGIDALIGSYDDSPAHPGFVSQFKNLMHSFVHQHGNADAFSFWTACGAIKRSVFEEHGGFDESYTRPTVEDIEFGMRMKQAGCKLVLDRRVQCRHLKAWTLWSLVKSDVLCRGIPWTRLILRSRFLPNDLNLRWAHRVSAALSGLVGLLCLAFICELLAGSSLPRCFIYMAGMATTVAAIAGLNVGFYIFLASQRGWVFSISALPLHVFYYCYSSVSFFLGFGLHLIDLMAARRTAAQLRTSREDRVGC